MNIPNFAIVDEGGPDQPGVYRGGQPVTKDNWDYLESVRVTQVIKLNVGDGDDEWRRRGHDLFYVPETLLDQTLGEPDIKNILSAVAFIRGGTFLHCAHGQDRTGLLVGAYRLIQGWTKERAYAEMKEHGFHWELFGLDKAWADISAQSA